MNITENYPKCALSGRKEIHPCVLQDIGPLGLLPCSHSTSSANHSKQGIGYRWPCAILGWLVSGISSAETRDPVNWNLLHISRVAMLQSYPRILQYVEWPGNYHGCLLSQLWPRWILQPNTMYHGNLAFLVFLKYCNVWYCAGSACTVVEKWHYSKWMICNHFHFLY